MPRLRPPSDPVTIQLDGEPVVGERGEPVAVSLVAAGRLAFARSPKFHRPRGPACLRGACDGCLARLDDVPNVMTCRVPAANGIRVETQNVVGSRETDLLRMSDWFFPEGMNHHELFAGVPGAQRVLQGFARRVAGLGRLPKEATVPRLSTRREVNVLVVGAGPAGMAAAMELAKRGRHVEMVDDDLASGGSACLALATGAKEWRPLVTKFEGAVAKGSVTLRVRTTAAGVYGDDVLVAGEDGVELVIARTLVLAPGAHDGTVPFEGNDMPGVMSARAACRLLVHAVVPGDREVVVVADGGGPYASAYARARPSATVVHGTPVLASGGARVKHVVVSTPSGERRLACDALLIDAPPAPAYELCAQAGAELAHEPRGYVVRPHAGGKIRDGVFAVGEAVGTPPEPDAIGRAAAEMAERA